MSCDINTGSASNSKPVLKAKFDAIVQALSTIDEEREAIKEIKKDLKEAHGIPPKIINAVVKIMKNPELLTEMENDHEAALILLDTLRS